MGNDYYFTGYQRTGTPVLLLTHLAINSELKKHKHQLATAGVKHPERKSVYGNSSQGW